MLAIVDNRTAARLLSSILRSGEFDAHAALTKEIRRDMLILDRMIPGMGGWNVFKAARRPEFPRFCCSQREMGRPP